jgi:hypothetical protein
LRVRTHLIGLDGVLAGCKRIGLIDTTGERAAVCAAGAVSITISATASSRRIRSCGLGCRAPATSAPVIIELGLSFRRLRSHRCHEVKACHFGSGRRQQIPNRPNGVNQEPVDLAKAAVAGLHKLQTLQTSSWRAEAEAAKKRKSATDTTTPGRVFRDCPDCPEMVVVPAGSFVMGSNDGGTDEKPVHTR